MMNDGIPHCSKICRIMIAFRPGSSQFARMRFIPFGITITFLFLLFSAFMVSVSGVKAASIPVLDCVKAKSDLERLICRNPDLLALEQKIQRSLETALRDTDSRSVKITEIEHKNWLEYRQSCLKKREKTDRLTCLNITMNERLWQMSGPDAATPKLTGAVDYLSVGQMHACAVIAGSVWCWGNRVFGDIPHIMFDNYPWPIKIQGLDSVTKVSTSWSHSCAISKGSIWCWGDNRWGQLGNGKMNQGHHAPTKVNHIDEATDVVVGQFHTCAIAKEKLWCWGHGIYGQLGNGGKKVDSPKPVLVDQSQGVTAVALASQFTCAIIQKKLKCWGEEAKEFVGNPRNPSHSIVPTEVLGVPNNIHTLTSDFGHFCAANANSIFCLGNRRENGLISFAPPANNIKNFSGAIDRGCFTENDKLRCWNNEHEIIKGENGSLEEVLISRISLINTFEVQLPEGATTQLGVGVDIGCVLTSGKVYCSSNPFRIKIGSGPLASLTGQLRNDWTKRMSNRIEFFNHD